MNSLYKAIPHEYKAWRSTLARKTPNQFENTKWSELPQKPNGIFLGPCATSPPNFVKVGFGSFCIILLAHCYTTRPPYILSVRALVRVCDDNQSTRYLWFLSELCVQLEMIKKNFKLIYLAAEMFLEHCHAARLCQMHENAHRRDI